VNYELFQRPALIFSLAALSLMTCLDVPLLVSLFCLILWVWKWLVAQNMVRQIPRKGTTILALFLFGFVLFQYRTIFIQEASGSLLVGLAAIKVMDYENRRDHLMLVLLGFLLLTLKPLFGMELLWLPVQLLCMFTLWWALSQDPRKIPRNQILLIFSTSLPIAFLLFLVFPRVVLPWAMSQSRFQGSGQLGFTTDLKPGQMAELASSSELVFRAVFPPSADFTAEDLYWKGALLETSEGLAWKGPISIPRSKDEFPDRPKNNMIYELIMEPAAGNYIFTLDPTIQMSSADIRPMELENYAWRRSGNISRSQRFIAQMSWAFQDTRAPRPKDLQFQPLTGKTKEWVEKVKAETSDLNARRRALRELFSASNFTYTLKPGPYNSSSAMDDFLFERRRGFCEHFAGSYATLARALGIPARVVSGYQGAEYNALGQFWRITQRNAHAWVEVWTDNRWLRVDPTLWAKTVEFSRVKEKSWAEMIDEGLDAYETLNYRWTTFLLDFDQKSQGLKVKEMMPTIFMIFVGALCLFFLFRLARSWILAPKNRQHRARQNQLTLLVQEIKQAEEEAVHKDLSHMPPLQVLAQAPSHLFGPAQFYAQVSHLYDRAFYQESIDEASLKKELTDLQRKWVEIQVLQK
jgi:protein-glutamine gamma-glutamyltransferase